MTGLTNAVALAIASLVVGAIVLGITLLYALATGERQPYNDHNTGVEYDRD